MTSLYNKTDALLQPIYDVFLAESDVTRNVSDWSIFVQYALADLRPELQERLNVSFKQIHSHDCHTLTTVNAGIFVFFKVNNSVVSLDELGGNQPYYDVSESGDVTVATYTSLLMNASDEYRSADSMEAKFKSREALLEELLDVELDENITNLCSDVNRVRRISVL